MKIQLHLHPYFSGKNVLSGIIPYFKNYNLEDLVKKAREKDIEVLGLERLNYEIFSDIAEKAEQLKKDKKDEYEIYRDYHLLKILSGKDAKPITILRGTEYRTRQDFDVISIGCCEKYALKKFGMSKEECPDIFDLIESSLSDGCLVLLDHPYADARNVRKEISKKQEKLLEEICKKYSGNILIEWNSHCIPLLRKMLLGDDVNKKARELSQKLSSEGHNLPIVSDGDVHARYLGSLDEIDKGIVEMPSVTENCGKKFIQEINKNLLEKKHINHDSKKDYVSLKHFVLNFGIPYLTKFKDVRG